MAPKSAALRHFSCPFLPAYSHSGTGNAKSYYLFNVFDRFCSEMQTRPEGGFVAFLSVLLDPGLKAKGF